MYTHWMCLIHGDDNGQLYNESRDANNENKI